MKIDVRRAVHGARASGPRLRMGLGRLHDDDWLELDHPDLETQLASKERLLASSPERFLVVRPEADEPSAELLALIESERARAGLARRDTPAGLHSLDCAGRQVREDLCVHVLVDGRLLLVGGSVCFPTHWSLPDFVGRPLRAVHGQVPHYETDLADKVDGFLVRLSNGPGVVRHNWSLVGSDRLSLPNRSRAWPDVTGDELAAGVWLRSERQTLRRLPATGAIVFTIGIDVEPLSDVAARPDDAALFAATLEHLSPELAAYKGIETIRPAIIDLLRAGREPTA